MSAVHYAIGDVHGRDDLLAALLERIAEHHGRVHPGRAGVVVQLGDVIDRGPRSAQALDRLRRGAPGFETVCLLGNHEAMMLACLGTDDPAAWAMWLANGGDATAASLGLELRCGVRDPFALRMALGPERIGWLRARPLSHAAGRWLFVHAGIAPGVPIAAQRPRDLLWIRAPFLESEADHGFIVVHGHTPGAEPELRANRIGLDTGAGHGGPLTAAVLDGDAAPVFLQAS